MSTLTSRDKRYLETLFGMFDGWVLNFTDTSFGVFFNDYNIDIHALRYQKIGTSKAKKLRAFWDIESDEVVGPVLVGMIEKVEDDAILSGTDIPTEDVSIINKCKEIAQRLCPSGSSVHALKQTIDHFNSDYITQQIARMDTAVYDDPALAIGTAKELIETCCKTILDERGVVLSKNPDVSELSKATFKELRLIPENIPDEAKGSKTVKRILQNLSTVGVGLAELRNFYGAGHGKEGRAKGLAPRHAKLAVGSASTLVTFLYDTHIETKQVAK